MDSKVWSFRIDRNCRFLPRILSVTLDEGKERKEKEYLLQAPPATDQPLWVPHVRGRIREFRYQEGTAGTADSYRESYQLPWMKERKEKRKNTCCKRHLPQTSPFGCPTSVGESGNSDIRKAQELNDWLFDLPTPQGRSSPARPQRRTSQPVLKIPDKTGLQIQTSAARWPKEERLQIQGLLCCTERL
ncbi:uncharacterized protein LOC132653186 isoform X3 [Meriones unguiculatus]|uniref:uncharacterized protein LOC132653186 isoform X3 n=1 Tax=Meriones unguiculatus TaxID=10047 RepID=UPI00293E3541|nr:uncharacterized protein LOC132653186 isoform X3 [Meriones unguiculatus]